eukprot:TRINITY_DN5051_c0_g1_i1.p1 TRINITY_DN5051_c0_g1~~TRINITY_DN5051_c0_g1_i1.p1  ORF type:complete len:594 (-),score=64.42 TRINITY_DN5051_c0_g1_i1:11-1792(-)
MQWSDQYNPYGSNPYAVSYVHDAGAQAPAAAPTLHLNHEGTAYGPPLMSGVSPYTPAVSAAPHYLPQHHQVLTTASTPAAPAYGSTLAQPASLPPSSIPTQHAHSYALLPHPSQQVAAAAAAAVAAQLQSQQFLQQQLLSFQQPPPQLPPISHHPHHTAPHHASRSPAHPFVQLPAPVLPLPTPVPTGPSSASKDVCRDFQLGKCFRGVSCKFVHVLPGAPSTALAPQKELCTDFLRGRCERGTSCKFLHPVYPTVPLIPPQIALSAAALPLRSVIDHYVQLAAAAVAQPLYAGPRPDSHDNDTKTELCRDFKKGTCTRGDSCRYSHDTDSTSLAEVCRDFLHGVCDRGDQCKYLHRTQSGPPSSMSDTQRRATPERSMQLATVPIAHGSVAHGAAHFMVPPSYSPGLLPYPVSEPQSLRRDHKYSADVCRDFLNGTCNRANCKFSHTRVDVCRDFHHNGSCARGDQCKFIHDQGGNGAGTKRKHSERDPSPGTNGSPQSAYRHNSNNSSSNSNNNNSNTNSTTTRNRTPSPITVTQPDTESTVKKRRVAAELTPASTSIVKVEVKSEDAEGGDDEQFELLPDSTSDTPSATL